MINLILCGGCGTRLWPVSRTLMPKQFAKLFDGFSLFQGTVVSNSIACESQYVISSIFWRRISFPNFRRAGTIRVLCWNLSGGIRHRR